MKFIKWYIKTSIVMYVIYALVAWIGHEIVKRHPLKNEDAQNFVELLFMTMKCCCLSPYYMIKWIFGKKGERELAE